MTEADLAYVKRLIDLGVVQGPVLELGAGWGGLTCRESVLGKGMIWRGTDVFAAQFVDYVADFESGEGMPKIAEDGKYDCVLVLNVLEHTFDPIKVLDNVRQCVSPDGAIVCITPAAWPIHNFPRDFVRLLPDWYRHYAETRGLQLVDEYFEYVGMGGGVAGHRVNELDQLPQPAGSRRGYRIYSRIIHRAFNTFGRGMSSPAHIAIGAVFRNKPHQSKHD